MKSYTRDGVDLAYEIAGDPADDPVLLLHGLGADHDKWKPQIERYPQDGSI